MVPSPGVRPSSAAPKSLAGHTGFGVPAAVFNPAVEWRLPVTDSTFVSRSARDSSSASFAYRP